MLTYLDNFQSVGPSSRAGRARRANAQRGLNENYARELLELHTLGVDGGYTQQDVQELARLLTGWTVRGLGGVPAAQRGVTDDEIRFSFEALLHEPGRKTVLGESYGEGEREGERAIRALCRHPSTARFIARKLVAHFVSDDPPPSAVARIESAFLRTRGDLRAVAAALIDLPEAWQDDAVKFRSPQDWLVAVYRGAGAMEVAPQIVQQLRQLRHPIWSPSSPRGYSDAMQDWSDPDSLLNRAELARTLARRPPIAEADPRVLVEQTEGVDGAARAFATDVSVPARDRVALAIAGPAFQWR